MYKLLCINLTSSIKNPSRLDIITMTNLVSRLSSEDTIHIKYTILDPFNENIISDKVSNMKFLNYISSKEYNDPFIQYKHFIKNNMLKP